MEGKTLILGAGWVGSRLARVLSNAVVTHRNGGEGIEFRIEDSTTWTNLPSPDGLGVVITFSLDVVPFETLVEFWKTYLSRTACVLAYSTTSVYEVPAPEAEVDETFPLTGKDLRGQSLDTRVKAEEFLRESGAIILTLSGIFGYDRTVDGLIKKGYIKNGNKLVNFIHVDDIIEITRIFLDKRNDTALKHQRFNVTSGAYRWQALSDAYGCGALPSAPTDTSSKVVSNKKLVTTVLPEGFSFRRADQPPKEETTATAAHY